MLAGSLHIHDRMRMSELVSDERYEEKPYLFVTLRDT